MTTSNIPRAAFIAGASALLAMDIAEPERRLTVLPEPAHPEEIPDRVCIEQDSPHFFEHYPLLGVLIDGSMSNRVIEFCRSEGWARLGQHDHRGRLKRSSLGKVITTRVEAEITPYWRDGPVPEVAVVSRPERQRTTEHKNTRAIERRLRQEARRVARNG